MMIAKLKSLLQQLLQSPLRFPVEAALSVAFFAIAVWHSETSGWNDATERWESAVNADILWLFVPLLVLTFWLHRVNRWAYFASFFLFLPLMMLNLKPFLWTYGFAFTYVLAAILLVVGNKPMNNRSFAAHALHVITQLFFGLLIVGVLHFAVMAIVWSFLYIFGIDEPQHLYEYILKFIWFVLAPQVCCTLIRQNEDEVTEPAKVLKLILNYILTPAIIIYTVLLYTYFIKIAFEWDLPKGGVAWLVMGFVTAALVGRMAQSILSERNYDWFYNRFTLIAIPPLIMYWVGCISAKSIGLTCQKQRLAKIMSELKLADPTGRLCADSVDLVSIRRDSLLCDRYKDACSVINYVRKDVGHKEFLKQYGDWTYSEYQFNYEQSAQGSYSANWYDRRKPVELGDYNVVLPSQAYVCRFDGKTATVSLKNSHDVLQYPIYDMVKDAMGDISENIPGISSGN